MLINNLSSYLSKISFISGFSTLAISWVEATNEAAIVFKSLGIIGTGAVAIWSSVAFFARKIRRIREEKKDDAR